MQLSMYLLELQNTAFTEMDISSKYFCAYLSLQD